MVAVAAEAVSVSLRQVRYLMVHPDAAQRLPAPFKIGRATFWQVGDVQAWLDRQATRAA